jgi:uncharacterized protein (TIGR02147 family)
MVMKIKIPRVYEYTDYRSYLRDVYTIRKKNDRGFSHRFISNCVGASSSGWFSDILNGRITLTKTFLTPLLQLLELRPREADFFELLVAYNQAENLEEKNRYLQKIIAFKDIEPLLINKNQFDFYRTWYFTALRELLLYYRFDGDYATLSQLCDPPIKPTEARQAIETLISIGLIAENETGVLRPVDKTVSKDSAFQSVHWRNFVVAMMNLAIESVDRHKAEERDLSSVTVGLSETALAIARQEVALLRKRLLALSEQVAKPDKIYQCNFQIFPLTQSLREVL